MAGDIKKTASKDPNRVSTLLGVASQTITVNGINFVQNVTPTPAAVNPTTHGILVELSS